MDLFQVRKLVPESPNLVQLPSILNNQDGTTALLQNIFAGLGGTEDIQKKQSYVVVFQFFYLGSIGWVDSCCESSSKDCSNIRYHPFRCIEAKNTHTVESGKNMIAMQTLQDFLFSRNEFQPCKTQRNECFRNSSYVLVVVCPRPRFLKVCISTIFKVLGVVN